MWTRTIAALVFPTLLLAGGCGKRSSDSPAPAEEPEPAAPVTNDGPAVLDGGDDTARAVATGDASPATDAAPSPPDCSRERVSAFLASARTLEQQKEFARVRDVYQTLAQSCLADLEPDRRLWLISDLAYAHYALGDRKACRDVLQTYDRSAVGSRRDKVVGALGHNAFLCRPEAEGEQAEECDYMMEEGWYCDFRRGLDQAPQAAYAARQREPCAFAPRAVAVSGDPTRCLKLIPGAPPDPDEVDPERPCVRLQLLEQTAGKVERRTLRVTNGFVLEDSQSCCGLEGPQNIATMSRENETLVVLEADSVRECYGGTARFTIFDVYRLEGAGLEGIASLGFGLH